MVPRRLWTPCETCDGKGYVGGPECDDRDASDATLARLVAAECRLRLRVARCPCRTGAAPGVRCAVCREDMAALGAAEGREG